MVVWPVAEAPRGSATRVAGGHVSRNCWVGDRSIVVVRLPAIAFDRHWLQAGEFTLAAAALVVGATILILVKPESGDNAGR